MRSALAPHGTLSCSCPATSPPCIAPPFPAAAQLRLTALHRRWLIAIAYWLAGGFIKSGLGNRIAYSMVAAFGKTTLGLTYRWAGQGMSACVHVCMRSELPDDRPCSQLTLAMQRGKPCAAAEHAHTLPPLPPRACSLVLGEALLSPAIPSVAARAGGIFFPLAKALCLSCGSDPGEWALPGCGERACLGRAGLGWAGLLLLVALG